MANELSIFDNDSLSVPAHVQKMLDERSNINESVSVPSLSYSGKVWAVDINGTKQKLLRTNSDGDEEPVSTMRVIVLAFNDRRGRAYYPGAYNPENTGSPDCWSEDGITPDAGVPAGTKANVTSDTCDGCPFSIKGSKVSDTGKELTACSQHRMLVVVPAVKPTSQPLRLKIAVTSDYDKQSPELEQKGFFAFSQYRDFLRNRGIKHTASLVTKMKFDPTKEYPKIVFSPDRWITEDEQAVLDAEVLDNPEVARVLKGYTSPAAPDGIGDADDKPSANDIAAKKAEAEKLEAQIAAELEKEEKRQAAAKAVKDRAAAKKKAEAEAEAEAEAKKPAVDSTIADGWGDDDDDGPTVEKPAPKAAAKPKADKPAPKADVPDAADGDLDSILTAWGDD